MNSILKVGEKDYPFHFGMRVVWFMSNSGEIEFDEVEGRIQSDYDSFLELFVIANRSAIERKDSQMVPVTKKQLERAIDDNPQLMVDLQEAFKNSTVIEKLNQLQQQASEGEETGNGKKPKE